MAQYDVYVFCDDCGETHPMDISIGLDDGPAEKASIGDIYKGRDLPQDVVDKLQELARSDPDDSVRRVVRRYLREPWVQSHDVDEGVARYEG